MVNKSVLLPQSRAIPRERGTSLLYGGTNRTLQLARYLDLINLKKATIMFYDHIMYVHGGILKAVTLDQKTLGSFLVNKSVLLLRVELYHVKEEPLYFIMVLIGPSN